MSTTQHEVMLEAPPHTVYCVLLDPTLIPRWRVPEEMRCVVHAFEAHEGGAFRVSLTYQGTDAVGKSSDFTDTYHGTFERLDPDACIVETMQFETTNPDMMGIMRITTRLVAESDGTRLTAIHEHLPPGIAPEDNEAGWSQSLAKLADLVRTLQTPDN